MDVLHTDALRLKLSSCFSLSTSIRSCILLLSFLMPLLAICQIKNLEAIFILSSPKWSPRLFYLLSVRGKPYKFYFLIISLNCHLLSIPFIIIKEDYEILVLTIVMALWVLYLESFPTSSSLLLLCHSEIYTWTAVPLLFHYLHGNFQLFNMVYCLFIFFQVIYCIFLFSNT